MQAAGGYPIQDFVSADSLEHGCFVGAWLLPGIIADVLG
jgi:hypothetical protein